MTSNTHHSELRALPEMCDMKTQKSLAGARGQAFYPRFVSRNEPHHRHGAVVLGKSCVTTKRLKSVSAFVDRLSLVFRLLSVMVHSC